MEVVFEGLAGVVMIGVFTALVLGGQIQRIIRRQRRDRSYAKTRPTIPHLAALRRPREW